MGKWKLSWAVLLLCVFFMISPAAAQKKAVEKKPAVVIAAFGTTVPEALAGILNIRERIQNKYPQTEVRIAFTSNMIRSTWHKRRDDADFLKANSSIPKDILMVQGPLATIANLQDEGFSTILVQPTHVALGEEYLDLVAYVNGLSGIRTVKEKNQPFRKLVVGRPALGTMGDVHPYVKDSEEVAAALAGDAELAAKNGSALVYMGHGNDYFPSGGSYLHFADTMNRLYPQTKTYVGTVEGFPSLEHVVAQLKRDQVRKVVLKPFLTVAGDHAQNDMGGAEEKSWKSVLTREGFEVNPVLQGLGEIESFADIFVQHLTELAQENGIDLK